MEIMHSNSEYNNVVIHLKTNNVFNDVHQTVCINILSNIVNQHMKLIIANDIKQNKVSYHTLFRSDYIREIYMCIHKDVDKLK